jgi:hypothetical protein
VPVYGRASHTQIGASAGWSGVATAAADRPLEVGRGRSQLG